MTEQGKAPAGAPNVLLIQLDGIGFGQASVSGGPAATPHLEALAASGSVYDRFHGASLSWSTRAALLTGINHHRIEIGANAEGATGFVEYDLVLPCSVASIGTIMAGNGYDTAWFEERHGSPAEDAVDRAREWITEHRSLTPGTPFFLYLTMNAQRSPNHVTGPFIEQYRGAFDQGWDVVRQEALDRQKAMGLIPADTELRPAESDTATAAATWNQLSDDERRRLAGLQETYAGSITCTDDRIGHLLGVLDELSIRRNTLVIMIAGESAGSAQAAWVGQGTSHSDGTRRLAVMSWPRRIPAGSRRAQFHHAIDVLPTVLDAAKITAADSVDGIERLPIDGVSMAYTWPAAHSPGRRSTQYFEHRGDRAIYHNGWFASARQGFPWALYDLTADTCQTRDLAADYPDKTQVLAELFDQAARVNNVHA